MKDERPNGHDTADSMANLLPDRKRSPEMSMATACHENVSMGSQFIDMSRRQQCRWARKFPPADGFEAS
ncbi:hypothetical protein [Sinorhizobium meliloti]|uniref:hypothetical protein n=1 Tax=Rhizobium meliloti TaxID=382 RepID=UPI000FD7A652|nr:hypothetical protein [Sinorhizobium meliloti]RVG74051.1 hypothetical protein CN220_06935 [Sinorhizobium meliloti]RVH37935.1 hypothetical protein CN211_04765 [Sinorhizobium meliloti]